jgi:hypothetical protein
LFTPLIYFLRIFVPDDVVGLCRVTAILLLPVALEMIYEKLTVNNLFSILGEGSISSAIRDGRIRARGPFAHAILGGTIGAVCLPLMIGLWQQHKKTALVGIVACLFCFYLASSSPIMSAITALELCGCGVSLKHTSFRGSWFSAVGQIWLWAPAYFLCAN